MVVRISAAIVFIDVWLIVSVVWAATTRNESFVKAAGLAMFIRNPEHRKELVAGNMAQYAIDSKNLVSKKVIRLTTFT